MNENIDAGVETKDLGSEIQEGVEAIAEVGSASEQDNTDWKAIAEAERVRAENYKTALSQKRQLRDVAPTPEEIEDETRPVTLKDLKAFQQQAVQAVVVSKEESLLSSKITDPAKRAYVKQLLETRIVRTGTSEEDIQADIEAALAIADSKKNQNTIAELKRAADNKPHTPTAGSSTETVIEQKSHKWTAEQSRALEAKAKMLNVDPEKFKKDAWANQTKTKVIS